jgi:hypothetical protein
VSSFLAQQQRHDAPGHALEHDVAQHRVVLGVLEGEALDADSATTVEVVMQPGPVTFPPDMSLDETAS